MSRRSITGAIGSAVLTAGLLTAPTVPAGAVAQEYKPYGRVSAPDQVLQPGCHRYKVNYTVKPPTDEWSALIQFYTPRGRKLLTLLLDANAPDPRTGTRRFEVCRQSVVPGRFKVGMNVVFNSGRERLQGKVRPTFFNLTRR